MKLVRLAHKSKLKPEFNFQVKVNPSELVGIDELWGLALHASTRDVAKVGWLLACLLGWLARWLIGWLVG